MASASRAAARHPERHRPQNDIFIAYCRSDFVNGQFNDCLVDTVIEDRDDGHRIAKRASMVSGPRIGDARNGLVRAFLGWNCEWMFMCDDDMTWHYRTFKRAVDILDEHKDIRFLSGLCFIGGRTYEMRPSLYQQDGLDKNGSLELKEYPKDALCKVGAVGAAWMFVHRDVFLDVAKKYGEQAHPWFSETEFQGGRQTGEDVVFCRRAREAGHDVWVHTGLSIGHMKTIPITEYMYDEQRAMDPETFSAARDAHNRGMGMVP